MKIIFIIAFLFFEFSQSSIVDIDITVVDSQSCNVSSLYNQFNCDKGFIYTLYVNKGSNCTISDGIHFNTISDAMIRAAELVPTSDNLVTIFIAPGTYTENVTIVSNTVIQGTYQSTFICGDVSWTASEGINSNYNSSNEYIFMNDLILASDQNYNIPCGSLTIVTTDKTDGSALTNVALTFVIVSQITNITVRLSDVLQIQMCQFLDTIYLYNGYIIDFLDCSFNIMNVFSNSVVFTQNCNFNSLFIQDSLYVQLDSASVQGTTTCINTHVVASQSKFNYLYSTSGSIVSILGCNYIQLFGDVISQIDRDFSYFSIAPTPGANNFTFPIAFIHAPSYIGFAQTSGIMQSIPIITFISNTDFVYQFDSIDRERVTYIVTVQNYLAQDVLI
jgi:hypothetical protein